MGDVLHPDGGIIKDFRMVYGQLPGHDSDIPGRCIMPVGVQTTAVDKVGVCHAESGGTLVHFGHEGIFAAGDVFGHSHTRSI